MGKYQSIHTGAQIDDAVGKVANNEATNGQVLMANGGGGAEWKDLQKQNVGLDKVDNTSDMEKPVSNAQQIAINDITLNLTQLRDRVNALLDSDDTTLDQMSEIVAYIKANKSLIESVTTSKVNVSDIINNLTTNVANKPLSASQGVVLKGLVDALSNSKLNASELPTAINTALAQAKASGEFDGKDGKTPVKGIDYFDGEKGDKGDRGEQGIQGIQGIQGERGLQGEQGIQGVSGVYVGSGDMPDGYNVQIDPTANDNMQAVVDAVLAQLPIYNGEVESV